jgi:hypothetical protein
VPHLVDGHLLEHFLYQPVMTGMPAKARPVPATPAYRAQAEAMLEKALAGPLPRSARYAVAQRHLVRGISLVASAL